MSKLEEKAKEYAEGFRLKVDDGSWYQQKVQDFIAGYGEGFNDKKQLLIEFSDWLREDDMSKYSVGFKDTDGNKIMQELNRWAERY
jgi:hypothetical protein